MDRYSQIIAWLKVLLPLTALALLSTLFLLSRTIDPVADMPFADEEIEEKLRGQQVTAPFFSGTTEDGDQVSIAASAMSTLSELDNAVTDMSAQIDLVSGTRVVLFSDSGRFDVKGGASTLEGNVVITTSTGYRLTTDRLDAEFDTLVVESPGPIAGTGPLGDLDAGKMRFERREGAENAHLIFTNGVKLVYDPNKSEE
ncbi:hypothetical protein [uncultured Tateyamaria sp.]|uniref:LPS export ABC transporter periplasmic protein LptC n=1 Tax=uncultured Tateyamaria sp. TaxID=455651 RepID=UPI002622EC0F|nr:hypothetical protein [uncultured Tateyamaria sp.]